MGRGQNGRVEQPQFQDARDRKVDEDAVEQAGDFDYWLYAVEPGYGGQFQVIPIRNPGRRAAKLEFRAGTWRAVADR